jgi:translation initiation factor IF-3
VKKRLAGELAGLFCFWATGVALIAKVESEPRFEGRQWVMVLSPR